ncbi:MAG: hypothetical protein A3G33_08915 [Omnitrophica bacterium RIFCSPLOWO2_12_FULL_44_17]|uniref:HAMP domain-containing protein n=1 Tax=Candidatus Danuiimicrobium aquiferis TaxID=1801832 RepID=A0A1G1L023_9BACT|nr:MAG: hypothetical protein A3B72_00005 [Omnitrophica bacterium RIFCSPHIGHO2_02_FULL_45_28]OGW88987.1 MAG: hypothetical protein A3E74_02085 [Omnitrophica bacterium RIFCSPHIGHO2_12_FULL_44_12]OGW98498.1 MAG: hypothetical protein A3G33_08915 [Omnitrophica bacterium RIFCSPLOWO2_12_FULL_44_17]OGX05050.1 MAG: hypothetical protein A3J12_08790 [Omnitrophica bacterium RIFCSPLOWO2_02_FULL_44_11]
MEKQKRRRTLGLKIVTAAQKYFVLLEFFLLMCTMVYLLYLIFGTISDSTQQLIPNDHPEFADVMDRLRYLLLVRISILFVVVFLVNVLLGLFYLHRLIGPLVRIRSVLSQIADGNIPSADVHLRKGDFPTDLAKELSRALTRIREMKNEPKQ